VSETADARSFSNFRGFKTKLENLLSMNQDYLFCRVFLIAFAYIFWRQVTLLINKNCSFKKAGSRDCGGKKLPCCKDTNEVKKNSGSYQTMSWFFIFAVIF
jgi:hypothetical protein